MISKPLLIIISVCVLFLILNHNETQAGEIIIHDQGVLTISNGSILQMNCKNLTVENGGTFILDGGAIEKRGKLILNAGSTYTIISGIVATCNKAMAHILLLLLGE